MGTRLPALVGQILATCILLSGCAASFYGGDTKPPFRDPTMSMQIASNAIATGKSTKADVAAALGEATVVTFDSGFEVWVYREKSSRPPETKAEFVILFDQTGLVRKTRLRPAYQAPAR
jgi:hypothetical protein